MAKIDKILTQAVKCIEAADSAPDLERELILLLLAERWMELADQIHPTEDGSEEGHALQGETAVKHTCH